MIAIIFGLLCASMFAIATVSSSRAVRVVSPYVVVGWAMLIGLVISLPIVYIGGALQDLGPRTIGLLVVVGAGNVLGLLLVYAALKFGKVSVVAPIVAAEGAMAAVLSLMLGEQLSGMAVIALAFIAAGVVLSSIQNEASEEVRSKNLKSVLLAVAAMVAFGASLFTTGFLSSDLPSGWLLLPPRLVGVVVITLPLALTRRFAAPKRIVPLLFITGICEVLGFVFFIVSAQESIAVASVLMSQYALLAALIGLFLFKERLQKSQVLGVVLLLIGVTTLGFSAAA